MFQYDLFPLEKVRVDIPDVNFAIIFPPLGHGGRKVRSFPFAPPVLEHLAGLASHLRPHWDFCLINANVGGDNSTNWPQYCRQCHGGVKLGGIHGTNNTKGKRFLTVPLEASTRAGGGGLPPRRPSIASLTTV